MHTPPLQTTIPTTDDHNHYQNSGNNSTSSTSTHHNHQWQWVGRRRRRWTGLEMGHISSPRYFFFPLFLTSLTSFYSQIRHITSTTLAPPNGMKGPNRQIICLLGPRCMFFFCFLVNLLTVIGLVFVYARIWQYQPVIYAFYAPELKSTTDI